MLKDFKKGVSLYLAMMVMTVLLTIGLGMTVILIGQLKMIRGMEDSVVAFHAADTGIERALANPVECAPPNPPCTETWPNGTSYSVIATTGGTDDCPLDVVWCIKSKGNFKGTIRAIEVTRSGPFKKVFVSSITTTGDIVTTANNLGLGPFDPAEEGAGLSAADAICQYLANGVGLTGTYKAWLSDRTTSAASHLTQSVVGPYKRIDGQVVAYNWDDLTDGTIQNPISINEAGTDVGFQRVWTNTEPDGGITSSNTCQDWTYSTTYSTSRGESDKTNAKWTVSVFSDCSFSFRLYCFEQ